MNNDHKRKETSANRFLGALAVSSLLVGGGNAVAASSETRSVLEVSQQVETISGIILDSSGEPVIGASILEKGSSGNGTISDFEGRFTLKVNPGASLIISYVGYQSQTVKAANNLRVVLKEDTELLQEVVVVGYGTQKKENLTGAVSSVDVGKFLEAKPQADIVKGMQGAVPGLSIVNSAGALNSSPEIRIRGIGTLSNKSASNPLIVVDGVPMEDISYLNTQDIQSISVLKDASSSSIYGARAAFGVILVTTKSAQKTDRVSVNYTNNFAWDTPTMLPDYPDVPTQLNALITANKRAGLESELFGMYLENMLPKAIEWQEKHKGKAGYREMILGEDFTIDKNGKGEYYADWDVVGIMFRKWKPAQSHNLSVQGTSGKTSYFMSFGYNHQEGVLNFNPDKLNKYTATLNVTSDLTDWFQLGGRFNYSNKDYTTPNAARSPYTYMWRWGSFFPYGTYQGSDFRTEPGYLNQANDTKQGDSYTRMGAFMRAKLYKGLSLNADYTYNIRNFNEKSIGGPVTVWDSWGTIDLASGPTDVTSAAYKDVYMASRRDNSYAFNAYADYLFTIEKEHNFKVLVGSNVEEGERYMHSSSKLGLLDPNLGEFGLATGNMTVSGWHNHWGVAGFFGRINYDWQGKLLVELNGRYDGSSKFPSNSRWAFFPSASAGYRISEERFMAPLKPILTNAKVRASYGEIGNQEVGDNMFISTMSPWSANQTYWIDGDNKAATYGMPALVSSTLKWERIQTTNIGLDMGLFNNELNLTFDWFQRETKDMLAPGRTMPEVLGASAPKVNAGSLRTRGWEINLDWNHRFNDFTVYASANLADYKTKVTKWDNPEMLLNQNYTGMMVGDIWGFETDRYFTKDDFNADGTYKAGIASQKTLEKGTFKYGAGDIKFKDLDGNGVIDGGKGTASDHGDLKVIGNRTPRYQYSFRLGGQWKGIDLDMFFQGIGKRSEWTQSAFVMPLMRGADAIYANQTSYWTEENPSQDATFPRLYPGNASKGNISVLENGCNNFYPQSRYLVNMSYLRFKNLTVGYTIPAKLTKKAYIQKARIYFSAENLAELINKSNAPVDPEINSDENKNNGGDGTYGNGTWGRIDPMFRTLSFGIQVTL